MNLLEKKKAVAQKIVLDLNKKYSDVYSTIEQYIKDHKLVVHDGVHTNYVYTIYASNSLLHANNLSNILVEYCKYTQLKTILPYKQFDIYVDMILTVKFITLANHKGKNIIDIINTKNRNGYLTLPKEIELISTYWKLYSIQHTDNWDDTHIIEKEQFLDVTGGRKSDVKLSKLYNAIKTIPCVVIGMHALSDNANYKLQIISHDVNETIDAVKTILYKFNLKYEIRDHDLKLHVDFRLGKKTIYLSKQNVAILDIFNSAEYELVPYIWRNNLRIGHPFVLCKFLLINLWVCQFQSENIDMYIKKRTHTFKIIENLRVKPPVINNVYGSYTDEVIAIKNLYKNQKLFFPYDPYKYHTTHGSYRIIKK
jgi:hypothetical protein